MWYVLACGAHKIVHKRYDIFCYRKTSSLSQFPNHPKPDPKSPHLPHDPASIFCAIVAGTSTRGRRNTRKTMPPPCPGITIVCLDKAGIPPVKGHQSGAYKSRHGQNWCRGPRPIPLASARLSLDQLEALSGRVQRHHFRSCRGTTLYRAERSRR